MNRKIRVAFFADILIKDFDGASRTMFQIIERIPTDQFEYLFFCGMSPKKKLPHEVVSIPTLKIPFNKTYRLAIPFFHQRKMRKRLDTFKPDVLHISSPSPLGDFAFAYKKKRDIPALAMYHTHFISYMEYYLKAIPFLVRPVKKTVAFGQKLFYNQADLILVPTQQMITELGSYSFNTKIMKIWQRGINHVLFNPSQKDEEYLRAIVGNEKPNILFASRLVWEKNLGTLIRIYRESIKRGDKYNFIIAGDGTAFSVLKNKMPNAYLLGKVNHENLSKLYATADVFLFPSISETYGNVVVEAMASGCTCVIARGGGSQSLVDHEKTGFLCEPNNEVEYLDRIDQIIANPILKEEMKANGLEYTSRLDWDKLAGVYFDDILGLAVQND